MIWMLLAAAPALGWDVMETEYGAELSWSAMPVTYARPAAGSTELRDIEVAVDGAFRAWERVDHADVHVEAGEGAVSEVALDEIDGVFFDPAWPWDADTSMALATVWADEHGNVVAFDIRVNGNVPWGTDGARDAFDLQAALTHEVGHVLGLDHSDVPDATMYSEHAPGESWRRQLHEDDLAGVRHLYGDGTEPRRGCASLPGRAPGLAPLLLLFTRTRRVHAARRPVDRPRCDLR